MSGLPSSVPIASVDAVDFDLPLAAPLRFGTYVVESRGYTVVAARTEDGVVGTGVTLNRGSPLAGLVRGLIAPIAVGEVAVGDLADRIVGSNPGALASGLGLRAASVVECAVVDAALRRAGRNLVGPPDAAAVARPVTALVGFPPTMLPDALAAEVGRLVDLGYRRFKLPVAVSTEQTYARLDAVIAAAPGAAVAIDLAWTADSVDDVVSLARAFPALASGWIEDAFRPGRLTDLAEVGRRTGIPTAAGDDDGGPYFVDAALRAGLDAVRLDATCQGGVMAGIAAAQQVSGRGRIASPHIHHRLHAQMLDAAAVPGPIEAPVPGSGLDPLGDVVGLPVVDAGLASFEHGIGLGPLNDPRILLTHPGLPARVGDLLGGA